MEFHSFSHPNHLSSCYIFKNALGPSDTSTTPYSPKMLYLKALVLVMLLSSFATNAWAQAKVGQTLQQWGLPKVPTRMRPHLVVLYWLKCSKGCHTVVSTLFSEYGHAIHSIQGFLIHSALSWFPSCNWLWFPLSYIFPDQRYPELVLN